MSTNVRRRPGPRDPVPAEQPTETLLERARREVFAAHVAEPPAAERSQFDTQVQAKLVELTGSPVRAAAIWAKATKDDPALAALNPNLASSGAAGTRKPVSEMQPPLQSSQRGGMGAVPYDTGTLFRVWAPGADQVFVAGDFNGWNPTEIGNEFNGNFSLDYPDAKPGQQYKFLIRRGQDWMWRLDPRAAQVTNSSGNDVIYDQKAFQWHHDLDFKMPPKNEQVVYEMHIGSFDDAPGWGPGNFDSAVAKLDHLKDLGVNVVEVMPSAEFPGDFSWGYNPSDPFSVESSYGGNDGMKKFVDEAHARGIAVVLDTVYNHFGPSDLPLWQFDGQNFGNSGNGGIYFYNDGRKSTPWGDTRPDFGRKEVRDYIVDNAKMWTNDYHVDGLRLDATYSIRDAGGDGYKLLQDIADAVHHDAPQKMVTAEDLQSNPWVTKPTAQGGAGADNQWDPNFFHPVDAALTASSDQDIDIGAVAGAITANYNGDATQRVVYIKSHDEAANGHQRLPSEVGGWDSGGRNALKKTLLGAALEMTTPGTPMLLQGEEWAEPGTFAAETPLNWDNERKNGGVESAYRDLIHLRRNFSNITQGLKGNNVNVFHQDNDNKVVAFHRWDQGGPGDDTLVVANLGGRSLKDYALGLPSDGSWKVRFNSDWKGYSDQFDGTNSFDVGAQPGGADGMPFHGQLDLGPQSVVILSKDR